LALITQLLDQIAAALPAGRRVLVQADRGIGTSPELLRAIQARGGYFLVRVQGRVRLVLPTDREVIFSQLIPRPGKRWAGEVYAFKQAGWLRCWAVGRWKRRYAEPWLLLTKR